MVNPQFQAATNIQNNYHTWNTNNVSDIRKWLKAPDPSTNFVAACDKRTPGTGEWIFSDPQFAEWREATSGILWIQGKVGSGKTFLLAAIIENLQANQAFLCCYYYFDNRDNSHTKTNARGLLQSLLLQMATRDETVHPALHELYRKSNHGLMEPTIAGLSATLEVVSKDLSPVYLVLDAMDECSEAIDVLKHLAHLKENLCIAVTSQYLAETVDDASWYIHLDDTESFRQDVAKYLKGIFSHRKFQPELLNEIVDHLNESAQGQFRWVDCQVTVLQRCKTPKAMREALKKLPKTLAETYTLAIERMNESEHVKDAGKLLMWLVYAFEPLSIAQVTDILAVDLEDQTFDPEMRSLELMNGTYNILDSTLITISLEETWFDFSEEKYIVQLAHNSVKDFLTQAIANHWPAHMERLVPEGSEHKTAKDLAISLMEDSNQLTYVNWIRMHDIGRGTWRDAIYQPTLHSSEIQGQLYYMARLNMRSIADLLLVENLADVNCQGAEYGNVLQVASWMGNKDMVQLFLEHNADVNAQGGKYGNALQAACWRVQRDIVLLLLEHKADVNAQGGEYGNALQAASWTGNRGIVQLLLEHNADVNAQGGKYGNALQAACWRAHKDVVLLLLECKAYAASWTGNWGIVQLLLKHKADVNAQGGEYWNALQAASWSCNMDIVHLLLDHKAGVNAQGGYYGNALQAASYKENKDIVQLLLEHQADVNAQGGAYGDALQAASERGDRDIVQILLAHKQDIDKSMHLL
ncbi:ankyrin repeat-containing domain protein [Rhodocollybia butyracea]|uniref:Ankyrin repeat-containing domain protein n=1 Tax=Rhodocollybia butyracea TaxID=206335 RepID=A0A9P5U4U8_9AGAR|nr:ankyrin repeat-containing domain protein [Rhodocollybia butyracea]